jgi:hypothetical protein
LMISLVAWAQPTDEVKIRSVKIETD